MKEEDKIKHGLKTIDRARSNQGSANNLLVISHFKNLGLEDVQPRINVFTYNAWLALGRKVKKGEKGCRITVFCDDYDNDPETSKRRIYSTTLFHITQTELIKE